MDGVTIASGYARRLVEEEARRSGRPVKDAIGPVARRLRAPPGTIWALLFRTPKRVCADLRDRMEDAMRSELRRQICALTLELASMERGDRRVSARTIAEAEASLARLKASLTGGAE